MPTTYSLRTRILSSNPYNNIYSNNYKSSSSSDGDNSSNYWIVIFLLIVLILVAVFVGGIYNTQGYYREGFEDGTSKSTNNKTLYFFYMNNCKWCEDFKEGAWAKLKSDMQTNPKEYLFKIGELNINGNSNNEDDKKGMRLAQKYKVNSTPTLILVDDNNEDNYEIFDRDRNIIDDLKKFGNKTK